MFGGMIVRSNSTGSSMMGTAPSTQRAKPGTLSSSNVLLLTRSTSTTKKSSDDRNHSTVNHADTH
eukprot:scaffold411130_cov47-Attheya_sp.AAC.5